MSRLSSCMLKISKKPKTSLDTGRWTILVLDKFRRAHVGFGVHTQISSLFTRFLAEETGSNFSSGLTSTIAELKASIAEVKSSMESKAKAFNRRAYSLTDNVKRLCSKTDVTYKAQGCVLLEGATHITHVPVQSFCGTVSSLSPPASVVLVAQHWATSVLVSSALSLPAHSAFIKKRFESVYQSMFKSSFSIKLFDIESFGSAVLPHPVCFLVSGSSEFFERYKTLFLGCPHLIWIWIAEQPLRDLSFRSHNKQLQRLSSLCDSYGLRPLRFHHWQYGGATNSSHLIGFGAAFLPWLATFAHPANVLRSVAHHWNSASRGSSTRAPSAPLSTDYKAAVLPFADGLLAHGLLNVRSPRCFFFGPSFFHPECAARRRLTVPELLCVYDIPMALDSVLVGWLEGLDPRLALPFEASVSPTVLASLVRSLWSVGGGVMMQSWSKERSSCEEAVVDTEREGTVEDDEITLESINSCGHEIIVTGTAASLEWDYDSDCDSLVPHPFKEKKGFKPKCQSDEDYENLEDESTVFLESIDDTSSLTSFEDESFVDESSSACSVVTTWTSDESADSIASVETLKTSSVDPVNVQATKEILENITQETIGAKAVKSDDAAVPVHLWNMRILQKHLKEGESALEARARALDGFRQLGLRLF
eukprot:scaffold1158_cov46-Cyclotella_meneghiniana.AAC.3